MRNTVRTTIINEIDSLSPCMREETDLTFYARLAYIVGCHV